MKYLYVALALLLLPTMGHSAQDYNSSRSNNSSVVAPDDIEKLLDEARADVMAVAEALIEAERRNEGSGFAVTVEVKVSVDRIPAPGRPIIREVGKR
ncbi:MAG: hypothetical protein R3183_07510 [Oleiphilaceae bacterium]|nr:hypothetical protein [Oleiphilaceae bacterium]